eukprot:TRINITY_DN993_c0_g1_i1.p1 TRINITY_DN993_c0_g1~~TRINITY_DN993_c0_g1_i1.p1  ORF type:complete len:422 (+),score=210.30 TRINITY_DN993_c0_g1_i1:108-1373(+)
MQRDSDYEALPVHFEDISTAAFRIRNGVRRTECLYSDSLSKVTGCEIWFKHDHRQATGSFKERGALNALILLNSEQRRRGVIAASAGNHALGLAYHGKRLDIPVTVVMPKSSPLTKVNNCMTLGASVHLHGNNIADAREKANELMKESGQEYINGYDHPSIIAGAGTLGLEILEQMSELDAILIPVGGAGLIAGVSLAVKKLRPEIQVIGIEPVNCASLTLALKQGKPTRFEPLSTLADGLAVPVVGENAFKISKKFVDKVITVEERFIALAILRLVELEKTVVEGGGAVGLAALLAGQLPELNGKKVAIALCGGNIDISVLGRVIERGLAADGRLIRFEAVVSDRPGGLAAFTKLLAEYRASVKDIFHERAFLDKDIATVTVRCVVETMSEDHAKELLQKLVESGYLVDADHSSVTFIKK